MTFNQADQGKPAGLEYVDPGDGILAVELGGRTDLVQDSGLGGSRGLAITL